MPNKSQVLPIALYTIIGHMNWHHENPMHPKQNAISKLKTKEAKANS
jgi:hypothetical protein